MQKKEHTRFAPLFFILDQSFALNGQKNLLRALKWGILCFCSYYNFGDTASIKNAIFAIHIVNLLVVTKLRKLENGYFHVFCSISRCIHDKALQEFFWELTVQLFRKTLCQNNPYLPRKNVGWNNDADSISLW